MANSNTATADEPFSRTLNRKILVGGAKSWGKNFTRLISSIPLEKEKSKTTKKPKLNSKKLKKQFHMLWHTVRSINGNSSAVTIKANILNLQIEKTEELTNPILLTFIAWEVTSDRGMEKSTATEKVTRGQLTNL